MNWPLDSSKTYILIEVFTVLLAASVSILFIVKRWDLTWGWRFTLPLLLTVFALVVQLRLGWHYKPRWGLFTMFVLGWVMASSTLAYHSDRPEFLGPEHISPEWLDLALFLPMIPIVSYAAEQLFRIMRPWMGWKRHPNIPFEAFTIVALLAGFYFAGIGYSEPASVSGQLMLGGSALIVGLVGFWFLPLRWAPRSILLLALLISLGSLNFGRFIGSLAEFGVVMIIIEEVRKRAGPIYELWARRKGLPIPAKL